MKLNEVIDPTEMTSSFWNEVRNPDASLLTTAPSLACGGVIFVLLTRWIVLKDSSGDGYSEYVTVEPEWLTIGNLKELNTAWEVPSEYKIATRIRGGFEKVKNHDEALRHKIGEIALNIETELRNLNLNVDQVKDKFVTLYKMHILDIGDIFE